MKIIRLIYIFSILTVMFTPLNLTAQDTLSNFEDLLNTEVVSGFRSKQSESEAPANIIVITQTQIKDRGYRTLGEIMKDIPGFDFSNDEPSGEYPAHFLFRGIGGVGQQKYVIMIDGIPQNDISNGWVRNIGFNFVLTDVERIEFVSGPGSSLYGLNAYAGFVNIITKNYAKKMSQNTLSVSAKMDYGSFKTYNPELQFIYQSKKGLAFNVSARYYNSQGDFGINRLDPGNYFNNNSEPDSILTSEYGLIVNEVNKKIPNGFNTNINDYYVRGKLEEGRFSLSFNIWNKSEGLGSEVVGYEYFTNSNGIPYNVKHQGKSLNFKYNYNLSDNIESTSKLYFTNTSILPQTGFVYTYQYQSVNNGINPEVFNKTKTYKSEGFLFGAEQQIIFKLHKKNKLFFGYQLEQKVRQYFEIHIEDNTPESVPDSLTVLPVYFSKNGAVLLQDEHKFGKYLKLTAGVRYDFDQYYGQVFNPRIAFTRSVKEGFGFKFLFANGFRAPTIFELYDEWRGNKNLTSERIASTELELSYKIKKRGFIKLNMFHYRLSNLISLVPNTDTLAMPIGPSGEHANYYKNDGNKSIMGIGLSSTILITPQLKLSANYQFLGSPGNEKIDNIAAHKINFNVNYILHDMININLRGNWIGKTRAPTTNQYFYPKTTQSIADVGYDYLTENNPDGYLDPILLLHLNIRTNDLLKSDKVSLEPHLLIKNMLNTQYVLMGRQSGDGVRPMDNIQSSIYNPVGFIPAYHPQAGRQFFIGLTFGF